MTEQIEAKLNTYDCLSMRNKTFTQMISKVTWLGSHIGFTLKPIKKFFSRMAGQSEGKLHTNVPQAMGVQFCKIIILMGHMVWQPYWIEEKY